MKPGFAIIVAVMGDGDAPHFRVLDETEAWGVEELIRDSYDLYEEYGVTCKQIPFLCYGDTESGYPTFINRFNEELTKRRICLSSPHLLTTEALTHFPCICRRSTSWWTRRRKVHPWLRKQAAFLSDATKKGHCPLWR